MNYHDQYNQYRDRIEEMLPLLVPKDVPSPLREAMLYSLTAGGKRLRAVLVLAAYAMLKDDIETVLPYAVSVEMVHTYSLIHDDLPAMDNDDLRRGKPTCHKVYGEGMAVLAGDGLLSLAFETVAAECNLKSAKILHLLAQGCGTRGMVAGQCADLSTENGNRDEKFLHYIHRHKTADLLTAPVLIGLTAGDATQEWLDAGREYGQNLGFAFQIIDDILDVIGDEKLLGKHTGKDADENKCTWISVYGMEKARKDAAMYTERAIQALKPMKEKAEFLQNIAKNMLIRIN